ncbi:probable N-acetyltransferase HLS1 [Diospyros lotus]|uniref:probable N-acetyltransferase HLS1 n=1 Tax=Diospyros lotus TaxID=55363 RepID=UPI00225214BD|nr:probable N-acetyltransferase HLS1 [Diospyros lotus]
MLQQIHVLERMAFKGLKIRSYKAQIDRDRVEELGRRCEVGPADQRVFFVDTMGDPICRVRNCPLYKMLVAELHNEIVGVIQGTIKVVTLHHRPSKDGAKVGYILGLRVSHFHRQKGIGSSLVQRLQEWFVANQVDYAYMATEKDNLASVNLFVNKLGFVKFRTPSILVQPVKTHSVYNLSPSVEIAKLKIEQAEFLYKKFMASAEFFPHDIDKILCNKLSLGTWVAYPKGHAKLSEFGLRGRVPSSWAMLSVWNSGGLFKLRMERGTSSCFLYEMYSRAIRRLLPCFKITELPDFFDPFGFYFLYGILHEGPSSGKLVQTLCKFVHNMATMAEGCKVIVTEVGGGDSLKVHIPHWKLLSCPEDLWCVKALKKEERSSIDELTKTPLKSSALFVDPREV